ncbi:MAG TPA: hypothetical protein VGG66_01935 [Rhizomicrobium sp.]|jgi:hypothetical protein
MTHLATDPLTLVHLAISLAAIVTGIPVLAAMLKGKMPIAFTGIFLGLTVLTSVTGFFFHNTTITPAMIIGAISLVVLAVALFALYGRHLAGPWRAAFVVTATFALYLNVFVLVIQSFIKIPALHALAPSIPPSGPIFGAVQGLVLIGFLLAGWRAVKAGRTSISAPNIF